MHLSTRRKTVLIVIGVLVLILAVAFVRPGTDMPANPQSFLARRLSECGALPNGGIKTVRATSRMFINVPNDIYPDINIKVTSHGATAGYVSNAGPYGYASGAEQKPNCWSYYFDFELAPSNHGASGTVDFSATSTMSGVPDYATEVTVTR